MRCHYEVLGVERDVDEQELKRAFRKAALRTHPDKNPDRLEEATAEFQLIQAAYAVLSDPQERAWYDRHREAILRGGMGGDGDDDYTEGVDLMRYFSHVFKGYGNGENGFYAVYERVFIEVAQDEDDVGEGDDGEDAPSFGNADSPYEEVHRFYEYWLNFRTRHTFFSCEKWDTRGAESRYVRRAMEKENKKLREGRRKEYNHTVRQLASHVRKLDKRVLLHQKQQREQQKQRVQEAEEQRRQKKLEDMERARAMMETDTARAAMEEMDRELDALETLLDEEVEFADDKKQQGKKARGDGMYCVACNKGFKSAKQWDNHEKSKKHKTALAKLRAELEAEDAAVESELGAATATAATAAAAELSDEGDDDLLLEDVYDAALADEFDKGLVLESSGEESAESDSESESGGSGHASAAEEDDDEDEQEGEGGGGDAEEEEGMEEGAKAATDGDDSGSSSDGDEEMDLLARAQMAGFGRKRAKQAPVPPEDGNAAGASGAGKSTEVQAAEPTEEAAEASSTADASAGDDASAAAAGAAAADSTATAAKTPDSTAGPPARRKKGKRAKAELIVNGVAGTVASQPGMFSCNVCKEVFPTRNKMFNHIKKTGHALRVDPPASSGGGGKRKNKKGQRGRDDWD